MVTLDDKTHTYTTEDGKHPVSVSKILNWALPMPSQFIPPDALEIGTIRHQWYHALAQGQELENEPDPRIAGEVGGFRRFMEEVRPIYVSGEVPYYDPIRGICGKPDLVAEIGGRLSICDYKPFTRNNRTKLQTAAYLLMLQINNIHVLSRFELRLSNDGTYRLEKHDDDGDLKRWPALVNGWKAAQFYK